MTAGTHGVTRIVLGLDFGGTKSAAAVSDLSGVRLGTVVIENDRELGSEHCFQEAIASARKLIQKVAGGTRLVGVGAATFGIPFDDRIELAPTIPGWEDIAFGKDLRTAFPGASVRVATDVKAAATAEFRTGALAGCDPAVYLNVGTGLAAAIISDGKVLTGRHGAAGEIAYNLRSPLDVGKPLQARVPLEDVVSGKALGVNGGKVSDRGSSAAHVVRNRFTEPAIGHVFDEFLADLCFHVVNLAIAIDPERIAFGGGVVRSWSHLEGAVRQALDAAVPYPPELVLGKFPYDAALVGALALALEAVSEAHPLESARLGSTSEGR
jgi:glucokinase